MNMFKNFHLLVLITMMLFILISCTSEQTETKKTSTWKPKRINKCIELLEAGQPIYYAAGYGGYDEGKAMAQTWGDYIIYNMEHNPLDFTKLRGFIAIVPVLGVDDDYLEGGAWMIQQALAQGVHGLHLVRARDPEAVQLFVQNVRYPIHKQGIEEIGEGLRGFGSHVFASKIWGISKEEYLKKADVWPLNPEGELMLGIKIEDQYALKNAPQTMSIPGLSFAEHGPRDMGLSYGYLEGRADPPVPAEVDAAGDVVLELCKKYNLAFLDNVLPDNVEEKIKKGVMIGAGRRQDSAEAGRAFTKRQMPW